MAKRSQISNDSRTGIGDDELSERGLKQASVDIDLAELYENFTDLKQVVLRNLIPATVIVAGVVTGNRYVFSTPGSEVKVDEKDVGELLTKRIGGCCGNQPAKYFEVVS